MGTKELIIKFIAGEASDQETDVLKASLEKSAETRRLFDQENELWHESDVHAKLKYFKTEEGWNTISSKLGIKGERSKSIFIINRNRISILLAVAAVSVLLAMGSVFLWLSEKKLVRQPLYGSTTVVTDEGQKTHIYLSDSTEVYMNSGSIIKYDAGFNISERNINLTGEAFFNVCTNPEKPFIVQLDQMTVSATGTKFNVLSYSNEERIETTLEEGKIQVKVRGQEPVEVKSGQQVVYFTGTGRISVMDVNTETYTSWKENKLRLIDTPFEESLRRIARRYNVVFEIRNSDLLDLKYTATFIDESIEEVMQLLKSVSPISYKINIRTSVNDKTYLKPKIIIRKIKA